MTRQELRRVFGGLNAGLRDAIKNRDHGLRAELDETIRLMAELDALIQAEERWGEPMTRERHLTVVK